MGKLEDSYNWFTQARDETQDVERKYFYNGLAFLASGLSEMQESIEAIKNQQNS